MNAAFCITPYSYAMLFIQLFIKAEIRHDSTFNRVKRQ
nr:MAG TPA: hypothetical protein [Caudoviricetes sp.]DAP53392.1 MAG TPA: hypothetical protein [Caudoviricetes sp.]